MVAGREEGLARYGARGGGDQSPSCGPSNSGMGQELRANLREAVCPRGGAGPSFPSYCLVPRCCPALQDTQSLKVCSLIGDSDEYREDGDRKIRVRVE